MTSVNRAMKGRQTNGVSNFQPMPWIEGKRRTMLPHKCRRHRGALLLKIQRDDKTGIRVGFQ